MEHQIVAVDVRKSIVVYICSCGEQFIGPGMDSSHGAKLPQSLLDHLDKNKRG